MAVEINNKGNVQECYDFLTNYLSKNNVGLICPPIRSVMESETKPYGLHTKITSFNPQYDGLEFSVERNETNSWTKKTTTIVTAKNLTTISTDLLEKAVKLYIADKNYSIDRTSGDFSLE